MWNMVNDLGKVQDFIESKYTKEQIAQVKDKILEKAKGDNKLFIALLKVISEDPSQDPTVRLFCVYFLFLN